MVIKLEPSIHFQLGGSGINRWFACAGSRNAINRAIEIGGKPKTNVYAAEGTVAHALLEERLQVLANPKKFIVMGLKGVQIESDGHQFTVDAEMLDAVLLCVNHIKAVMEKYGIAPENCATERMIKIPGHDEMGGSADWSARTADRLFILDYKHGKGKKVDEKDIKQLMFYALGSLFLLNDDERASIKMVQLDIFQPRHYSALSDGPVMTFEMEASDLLGQFHEACKIAAAASDDPNAPLTAGPQCEWCPATMYTNSKGEVFECPALKKSREAIASNAFANVAKAIGPDVTKLSPEQIGLILANRKAFEKWLDQAEEVALVLQNKGIQVPGQKLVKSYGDRKYTNEAEVEDALTMMIGDKAFAEPKLISPAVAEKIVGKEFINNYCTRPFKGIVTAPTTDKREAVDPAKMFESVKQANINDI